jgi:hypothetical protein
MSIDFLSAHKWDMQINQKSHLRADKEIPNESAHNIGAIQSATVLAFLIACSYII